MVKYKPGICNIGGNERRKRYELGIIGIGFAIVLAFLIFYLGYPRWSMLICFIPFFLGSEGMLQGYLGFCVGFANRGIFDLSDSGKGKGRVPNKKAHNLDMSRANMINLLSLIAAGIMTLLVLYLI